MNYIECSGAGKASLDAICPGVSFRLMNLDYIEMQPKIILKQFEGFLAS